LYFGRSTTLALEEQVAQMIKELLLNWVLVDNPTKLAQFTQ